jgi:hypothetical protein
MCIAAMFAIAAQGAGLTLKDADGRLVRPFDNARAGTVFIFTRTDCPISNRYAPEISRLHDAFARNGIAFWLVYVDPAQTAGAVRRHMAEYGYRMGALLDPRHELVSLTQAEVTPEAVVYCGNRIVYRGRIDDQYAAFGKWRPSATTHDLEDVLTAIAAGRTIQPRTTRATGCFISDVK